MENEVQKQDAVESRPREKDAARLRARIAYLESLIKWVAPRIERRNGNGAIADRFCLLCVMGPPLLRKEPCRHEDIWRIAKRDA